MNFTNALQKIYKDYEEGRYTYITTDDWLESGCIIGFASGGRLGIFKINSLANLSHHNGYVGYVSFTGIYSPTTHEMKQVWYYYAKEDLSKLIKTN